MDVDAFAYAPVIAGMWKQHEVFDGTYTFDDLLDAHEIIATKAINEQRAAQYAQQQKEARGR